MVSLKKYFDRIFILHNVGKIFYYNIKLTNINLLIS